MVYIGTISLEIGHKLNAEIQFLKLDPVSCDIMVEVCDIM